MISWETSYLKHCSIKFKSCVEIESGNYKERNGEKKEFTIKIYSKLIVLLEAV